MRNHYLLVSALLLLLVSGCDVRDKSLHEVAESDVNLREELSAEEFDLLTSYVTREAMTSVMAGREVQIDSSLTIREIIQREREQVREDSLRVAREAAEAEEATRLREAEMARLRQAVAVNITRKGFKPSNYSSGIYDDQITVSIVLKNNTDREIAGVKGNLVFRDIFGDEIMESSISYDQGIPSGESKVWNAAIEYNQFMDEHEKLRSTPLEKIRQTWEPEVILFADGASLKLSSLE